MDTKESPVAKRRRMAKERNKKEKQGKDKNLHMQQIHNPINSCNLKRIVHKLQTFTHTTMN